MENLGHAYFYVCAAIAVFGALATISSPNPIRCALGLLLMIVSIAGLFLPLHAEFLATIQLIVYAGAIVVLFLFVIMLLGPSAQSPRDNAGRIPRYASAGLYVGAGAGVLVLLGRTLARPKLPVVAPAEFGSIDAIGKYLFTDGIVPFELSSALLIVAVVGAVAIAKGKHGELHATYAGDSSGKGKS